MDTVEMRLIPKPDAFQIRWPFRISEVADGLDEDRPVVAGARRRGKGAKSAQRVARLRHVIENALGRSGADAREEVQHAKAGNSVARIFDEPQQRKRVLDVRGVEKLEAAEFHERTIAAGEVDFPRAAMRGGAGKDPPVLSTA